MKGFNPITPVPKGMEKGWKWYVDGKEIFPEHVEAFDPNAGTLIYGSNGRYDQIAIRLNPGFVVVYCADLPDYGLVMGGADEPRFLANGEMFTPAGGLADIKRGQLDKINAMPKKKRKAAMLEYEKLHAAREVLEEMRLLLPTEDLIHVGRSASNRSVVICDIKMTEGMWYGTTSYANLIDASLIGPDLKIKLPENKLGDIDMAPEWSRIKKLKFKKALECLETPDEVALAAYSKTLAWFLLNVRGVSKI